MQHAQPALLYLVPGCIGASFLTALALGDVKGLLSFSEEEVEEKSKQLKK